MSVSAPPRRHVWRWLILAIVAVLVALAAALVIYVYTLLQPQRFTALLESELADAGLKLTLQAPAKPRLFPHPGVHLKGLTLGNAGAPTPLLTAKAATIVIPWRALLHGEVAIERVDIDAPHIDLDELEALFTRFQFPAGPPVMPTIATGVHIRDGILSAHGTPLLFGFSLDTGALAPGKLFRLHASARSASRRKVVVSVATVPAPPHDGAIVFQPVRIKISEPGGASLRLKGKARWSGGTTFALQLAGNLRHRTLLPAPSASGNPATASATTRAATTADKVSLTIAPGHGTTPMTATFELNGANAHVQARLQPAKLGTWWHQLLATQPGPNHIPIPFTGKAKVRQVDLGGIKAKGLTIEAGPDLTPASATSAARPASAATTGR